MNSEGKKVPLLFVEAYKWSLKRWNDDDDDDDDGCHHKPTSRSCANELLGNAQFNILVSSTCWT